MSWRDNLRNPVYAALVAFVAVVGTLLTYDHFSYGKRNKNSRYIKPAFLVALLVYAIVYHGNVIHEVV